MFASYTTTFYYFPYIKVNYPNYVLSLQYLLHRYRYALAHRCTRFITKTNIATSYGKLFHLVVEHKAPGRGVLKCRCLRHLRWLDYSEHLHNFRRIQRVSFSILPLPYSSIQKQNWLLLPHTSHDPSVWKISETLDIR